MRDDGGKEEEEIILNDVKISLFSAVTRRPAFSIVYCEEKGKVSKTFPLPPLNAGRSFIFLTVIRQLLAADRRRFSFRTDLSTDTKHFFSLTHIFVRAVQIVVVFW